MHPSSPCEAIAKRRRLEIRYDGYPRVVEVHAVGRTKEGNWLMRVWQVRGGSSSEPAGWKLMRLDEVGLVSISKEEAQVPRAGYKRTDPAMAHIECQV